MKDLNKTKSKMKTKVLLTLMMLGLLANSAHAYVEYFDLSVAGTRVSSQNYTDVTGDGSVVFSPTTNTLTLNGTNLTYTATAGSNPATSAVVMNQIANLQIVVEGESSLTSDNGIAILTYAPLSISGSRLNLKGATGIYTNYAGNINATNATSLRGTVKVTVTGGIDLRVEATGGYAFDGLYASGGKGAAAYACKVGSVELSGEGTKVLAMGTSGATHNLNSITRNDGIGVRVPTGARVSGGNIIDSDGNAVANQWCHLSALTGVAVDDVNFPNISFRAAVIERYPEFCEDYLITPEENEGVTRLELGTNAAVASVKGVELLPHVTYFALMNSAITEADFSQNIALGTLILSTNASLAAVDISGCENLNKAQLNSNALAEITLPVQAPNLEIFTCYDNELTALNLEAFTSLKTVNCNTNQIASLAVASDNIETIKADYNNLESFAISNAAKLTQLSIRENEPLATLSVTNCTALKQLYADNGSLTSVNLEGCKNLNTLWLYGNQLESINLTNLNGANVCTLGEVMLYYNKLTSLDFSKCNLYKVGIYCNHLSKTAIDNMISTLPRQARQAQEYSYFDLYRQGDHYEGNFDVTPLQAQRIWNLNYRPRYFDGESWVDYEQPTTIVGDIDGNGLIEVNDVVMLAEMAMGGAAPDGFELWVGDMDDNGLIEVNDVVILAGIAMGG